jgi:hypothetical protein
MDWITALSVPLGVVAVFLLFRAFFPRKASGSEAPPSPEEKKRFHRIHLLSTLSLPMVTLALLYPLALVFSRLRLGIDAGPDLVFAGLPGVLEWGVACLLASVGLSLLLVERIEAMVLKQELARFRAFQSGAYGFDSVKVRSFLRTAFLVSGVSALALMLDFRLVVRKDKVLVDPFLSLTEEAYPLSQVDSVLTAPKVVAPNGKEIEAREYVLKMSDGRNLSSISLPGVHGGNRDTLFTLIAALAGKPVTEKPILGRDDLR